MVELEYLAHSCFRLVSNNVAVLFDPYGPEVGYKLPYRRAQYTLVSHDHFDHNHTAAVEGRTTIVRGSAPRREHDVSIRGILASHDAQGGSRYGPVTCFVVELGGIKLCHLSDLGHQLDAALLKEIGPVDVALVPTGGGGYTLNSSDARRVVEALQPALAIPMHFRTPFLDRTRFPELEPLDTFQSLFPQARTERSGKIQLDAAVLRAAGPNQACCLSHIC
jgi:L-ascorbate metabolism protein UlaG (beta-lactamase superfamily)